MRTREDSWHSVLDRALLLGCALWIALQTPNTVISLLGGPDASAVPGLAAALLGRVVLMALCLYAASRGVSRQLVAAGLVAGTVAVIGAASLSLVDANLGRSSQLMVPTDAIQAVQIFAVGTAVHFRNALWTILATFPVHLLVNAPAGITWDTVEQWVTPTSATVALSALVAYLRSGSVYAEQLDTWNRAARTQSMAAASHDLAVAEARRVIHDDVISALRGIQHCAPQDAVLAASRTALASLGATSECATLEELLAALEVSSGLTVDIDDSRWAAVPPARVLEAFRGAASEALRNVTRHSGSTRARVTARMRGRSVVLEIRDRGRGFVVGESGGFGIPHSIVARLEQVGGTAQISSEVGLGTTVALLWTPPEPPPAEQLTPYASDQRWRGYLPVALAITANSSFLAWRHPGPHPELALGLALFLAFLLPLAAWRFAFRPPVARDSLLVAVVVSVITWFGLEIAGPGALLDMRSWVVGFGASITMLLAFDARPRHVVVPVAAQIAVCMWVAAADPTIGVFEPVGALTTPIVICGFSSLFGALLRRGAHLIRQGEATLAARLEESAWQAAQDNARRVHLETLRQDVAPFLADVVAAEGSATDDPAVRQRAGALSARCRDDLLLPHPLPDGVRRSVAAARADGATISFRVAADQATDWPPALDLVLDVVLKNATPAMVTVIAGERPRVVVLPSLGRSSLVRVLKVVGGTVTVRGDDVRTILELSSDGRTSAATSRDLLMGA